MLTRKQIEKITTILDEDIGEGFIVDFNPLKKSKENVIDDDDEIEVISPSQGFSQHNLRSQMDYDSDEEYDRLHFVVSEDDHTEVIRETFVEVKPVHTRKSSNETFMHQVESCESPISDPYEIQEDTAVSDLQNKILKPLNCNDRSFIKPCIVMLKKISIPKEFHDDDEEESSLSDSDFDEDLEKELDKVFAEIEALEKMQEETNMDQNSDAISIILDSIIEDVMCAVVEPWSNFVPVKRMEGGALDRSCVNIPPQVESGWDSMEITSQPAESAPPLNYYFAC